VAGLRLVFGRPAMRTPMLLAWLCAFYNVPEGVAAPLVIATAGGIGAVCVLALTLTTAKPEGRQAGPGPALRERRYPKDLLDMPAPPGR
jgi:hypothetical protein